MITATAMYATMFFSFTAGEFVETGIFVNRDDAQAWIDRRVGEEPHVYQGHPERLPYIVEKEAR
jgi:hypothetical protein